ncbi:MAG: rRNA maturation RNase YbeY [Lentisphaeria bacterium]|nr:rRNA maturation RNase YbeY [Lentisphaeria bacterium]
MYLSCQWRAGKTYPAPSRKKLIALVQEIVRLAGGPEVKSATVTFLTPEAMAEVNESFLGHTGSTDVISFDYRTCGEPDAMFSVEDEEDGEDIPPCVELFICPAVAQREAEKRSLPYSRELTLYIAHGFLHAAGYDDLQPELKRKMRRAEHRVMSALPAEMLEIFKLTK